MWLLLVSLQTASTTIKHMSLGVIGFGNEDALIHLLNFVWPNIFEVCCVSLRSCRNYVASPGFSHQTSPHVIGACMDAIAGLRMALGASTILSYTLQGLFHPARKVRAVYWKVYNTMYIGAQDALVAAYPRIPNDEKNNYIRQELYYTI